MTARAERSGPHFGARALSCLLLFASAGCSERYQTFSDAQLQIAVAAQRDVQSSEPAELVQRIYAARLADPEKDTTRRQSCRGGSGCVYSRVATAELIREYWSAPDLAGTELREQVVTDDGFTTRNLFLDIPGQTRPDEWVLASAHYDAWFGGANDNATGVAVLLTAARPLRRAALDRSVRLVLFDGEELGMVGSGRYVAKYGVEHLVLVVNADSIAFVGEPGGVLTGQPAGVEYIVQANEASAGFAFQFADLARRMPQPTTMRPLVFPGNGVSLAGYVVGFDLSDHAQFWLADTPALFPFPAGDKPAWYHTADDTPDKGRWRSTRAHDSALGERARSLQQCGAVTFTHKLGAFVAAGTVSFVAERASALEVEVAAQSVATLTSDDATKGGGIGLGLEGGVVLARGFGGTRSAILARARMSVLGGAGLAWTLEAGAAWRGSFASRWQPEVGAYVLYMGGDLARTIDEQGRLAGNPLAALVGVSPLRFALDQGWVAFLAVRGGVTLGSSGRPPLAASITLFEVGRAF